MVTKRFLRRAPRWAIPAISHVLMQAHINPVHGLNARIFVRGNLSPLRGEGAAIGGRNNLDVVRHSYDGVQRTARPTKFGSWPVSRSEGNRELSMILFLVLSATPAGVERVFWRDRSGGIAALNLRLLSLTPPVSRKGIPGTAGFVPGPCQKMTVRDKTGHRQ